MWKEIRHDKLAMGGLILFALIVGAAYILPLFIDQEAMMLGNWAYRNVGPGPSALFGHDPLGRDMLPHLIISARNSFNIAFIVTGAGVTIGMLFGLFAGFYGGHIDNALMRVLDFFTMIPPVMIIIVFVATVPNYGVVAFSLILVLVFSWQGTARLIRSMTLRQSHLEYVAASKTLGTRNTTIIFREVLPNLVSIATANLTIAMAGNVGIETGLTMLGLGLPHGTPSLGRLIFYGITPQAMRGRWWQWIPAALLVIIMMLCINFVGQALNRAADAKKRLT
jgi:peptide/nickel transport system permease protein